MESSELRIGNWVNATVAGNPDYKLLNYQIKNGLDIDSCDWWFPIPLTEEILLKCGFEKDTWEQFSYRFPHVNGYVSGWVKDIVYCFVPFNEHHDEPCFFGRRNKDDCMDGWNFNQIGSNILYLHQLQNLYFALTGEELEVKL